MSEMSQRTAAPWWLQLWSLQPGQGLGGSIESYTSRRLSPPFPRTWEGQEKVIIRALLTLMPCQTGVFYASLESMRALFTTTPQPQVSLLCMHNLSTGVCLA